MKTIPAVILHAPKKFGGIGLQDFYTVQGIEHLKALIDEGGTDSPTGKLMNILLHDHALELGVSGYFLDQDFRNVQHLLTETWLQHTLQFTSDNQITVEHKQSPIYKWRRNDTMIMEDILQAQGVSISKDELQATNRCRIYLQVNTRSDITNGEGTTILDAAWRCIRDFDTISGYAYKWPFQPRPNKQDIATWQRVLSNVYGINRRIRRWQQPLRLWSKRSSEHTCWMYDTLSDSLYKKNGEVWTRWRRITRRTRSNQFTECIGDTQQKEERWQMARVLTMPVPRIVVGLGHGQIQTRSKETRSIQTQRQASGTRAIAQGVRRLPASVKWVFEKIRYPTDNGRHIAQELIKGTAKCISDRSSKWALGTSAATYVTDDENKGYLISNCVPGEDKDQHSYRSKLCGIIAKVMFLSIIAKTHGIEDGSAIIACDNESALWTGFNHKDPTCASNSYDLLKVLKHEIKSSPIRWTTKHVQGHQDRDRPIEELDKWAQFNVLCDREAEDHWNTHHGNGNRERPAPGVMPGEGWRVTIGNQVLVNNIGTHIYEHIYYTPVMSYWEEKKRINPGMGDFVEWEKYDKALKRMPFGKKQWVRKHYCGFEATNLMLHKCKKRTQPHCPQCAQIETHRHITKCRRRRSQQAPRIKN